MLYIFMDFCLHFVFVSFFFFLFSFFFWLWVEGDCLRENWTVGMFLNSNMAIAGSSVATGWYLTFFVVTSLFNNLVKMTQETLTFLQDSAVRNSGFH